MPRCCCFEPQSTTGLAPMGLNQVLGPLLLRPLPGVVEEGEGAGKEYIWDLKTAFLFRYQNIQ